LLGGKAKTLKQSKIVCGGQNYCYHWFMRTVERVSIALTPEMAKWLREAVRSGEYANARDVVQDALRMWKREREVANAQVLASVKQGLKESAEGKTIYRGSFAKYI
jgi:putative addiction module CopG family antidote